MSDCQSLQGDRKSPGGLLRALKMTRPGDTVTLTVSNISGETHEVTVIVGES